MDKAEEELRQSIAMVYLMDDNEARFLIDQFNKFASWRSKREEMRLTMFGLVLAIFAMGFSVYFYEKRPWSWVDAIFMICLTIGVGVGVFTVTRAARRVFSTYEDDTDRLKALERYRFENKKLPDTVTFEKITDPKLKAEDFEKLLRVNQSQSKN